MPRTSLLAFVTAACLIPAACNLMPGGPPRDETVAALSASEAQALARMTEDFAARGHEPGWLVRFNDGVLHYTGQYGEDRASWRQVTPRLLSDGFSFDAEGFSLRAWDRICRDAATGMPYPYDVTISRGNSNYSGCGGNPVTLLEDIAWQIVSVANGTINSDQPPLIRFEDGTVSGLTGCNRFLSSYELTGEGLRFGPLTTTRMACMGELNQQEQAILTALESVDRFDIEEGRLVLISGDVEVLRAER